jgi:hypothetical protein
VSNPTNRLDADAAFEALVSNPLFTEVEYVSASLTGLPASERNRQQNRASASVSNFRRRAAREGFDVFTRSQTVGDTVYGYVYVTDLPEHLVPSEPAEDKPLSRYSSKHADTLERLFGTAVKFYKTTTASVRTLSTSGNRNRQYHLASRLNAVAADRGLPLRFVTKTTQAGTRIDVRRVTAA